MDDGPSTDSMRGDSAKASAATMREASEPMPRASASFTTPTNATTSTTAHHARCTTHGGSCARSPSPKNGPIGNRYPYAWFCT